MASKYSQELKDQIVKEVMETGSTTVVANKHGVCSKTVHNWLKNIKNKDSIDANKQVRLLTKKLADKDLEIEVLRSLLKKTYPHWNSAEVL
jgi:transposase